MLGEAVNSTLTWKGTGSLATIDSCPASKLVYYLHCVNGQIDPEDRATIPYKFKSGYQKPLVFRAEEKEELLRLARSWHPDVMMSSQRFQKDNDENFCKEHGNAFIEFDAVQTRFDPIARSISETRAKLKVMCFTQSWADANFHVPYAALEKELISERARGLVPVSSAQNAFLAKAVVDLPRLLSSASGQRSLTFSKS
jgi:hypothetical protein